MWLQDGFNHLTNKMYITLKDYGYECDQDVLDLHRVMKLGQWFMIESLLKEGMF